MMNRFTFDLGRNSEIFRMTARLMKEYKEASASKDTDIRLSVHDNLYKWTALLQGCDCPPSSPPPAPPLPPLYPRWSSLPPSAGVAR